MNKFVALLCAGVLTASCAAVEPVRYSLDREYRRGRFGYKECVVARKNFADGTHGETNQKESARERALYKAISRLDYYAVNSACNGIICANNSTCGTDCGEQYERIALLPVLEKFDRALGRKLRMNRIGTVLPILGAIGIGALVRKVFNRDPKTLYGTTKLGVGLVGGVGAASLALTGMKSASDWRREIKDNALRILNELLLKGPFIEGADAPEIERVLASIAKKLQ